jgi:MFS superfamily sulfate permease-like transporter
VIPHVRRLKLGVHRDDGDHGVAIRLSGAATFVQLPKLSEALDRLPAEKAVVIDGTHLAAIDHTCAELLRDWLARRRSAQAAVTVLGGANPLARLAA